MLLWNEHRQETKLATNTRIAQLNLFLQSYKPLSGTVTLQMYCDMSKTENLKPEQNNFQINNTNYNFYLFSYFSKRISPRDYK